MTFLDVLSSKQKTIYELSSVYGIPKTTLHDISKGETDLLNCTGRTLLAISKALNITIEELLSLDSERTVEELPTFLKKSIYQLRKGIRDDSSLIDCFYDELTSSINVAEVDGYISKWTADRLRKIYLNND